MRTCLRLSEPTPRVWRARVVILELWTDGSARATGGPGGWAFVLRAISDAGEVVAEREESGSITHATNNRAELTAVLRGLRALTRRRCHVVIVTDSEYVMCGFTEGRLDRWLGNGWRTREGEPVQNRDLWEQLLQEVVRHDVTWRHVKGHTFTSKTCDTCGLELPATDRRQKCPTCGKAGQLVKVPEHPLNHRCDELAGAARRALLEAA